MEININNYESYFIDYIDDKLSSVEEIELMLFLDKHPKLKEEIDIVASFNLQDESLVFSNKNHLKKNEINSVDFINEDNYEEVFIASHENDLNENEIKSLDEFVKKNSDLKKEHLVFEKVKLQAEPLIFEHKESLKKKNRLLVWQYSSMATAASIALLMSLFFLLNDSKGLDERIILPLNYTDSKDIVYNNDIPISIDERETQAPNKISPNIEDEISVDVSTVYNEQISINPNVVGNNINGNQLEDNSNIRNLEINQLRTQLVDYEIAEGNETARLLKDRPNTSNYFKEDLIPSQKSLFAKFVDNNTNKLADAVASNGIHRNSKRNSKDPGFVRFLQGSISFFNTVTGSDVEQHKVYDNDGNLQNYQIETPALSMNKNYAPGVE